MTKTATINAPANKPPASYSVADLLAEAKLRGLGESDKLEIKDSTGASFMTWTVATLNSMK